MAQARGRRGAEAGQGSLEYLATIVVASVLTVAVLLSFTGSGFGDRIAKAVCDVKVALETSGAAACTSDGTPVDYKPPLDKCMFYGTQSTAGSEVKIIFFTIGNKYTFKETHFRDGHVELTFVGGADVGVEGGLGGKIRAGDFKIGATVDASASLGLSTGDTYVFASAQEAEDMRAAIELYEAQMTAIMYSQGPILFWPESPRDPDKTTSTITLSASVDGTLGLGIKDQNAGKHAKDPYFNPNINLKLGVDGSSSATVTTDHRTGAQTFTYSLKGSWGAEVNAVLDAAGIDKEYGGTLALSYDKDGTLTGVTMTTIRETTTTDADTAKTPWPGSEKANIKLKNGEGVYQTDSVYITVNDKNRSIVEAAVGDLGSGGSLLWDATTGSVMPSTISPDSNDFQKLLYEQGVGLTQYYTVDGNGGGFGIEAKVGIQLGFSADWANEDTNLIDSTYLGAPGPDGVRVPVPYEECTNG